MLLHIIGQNNASWERWPWDKLSA